MNGSSPLSSAVLITPRSSMEGACAQRPTESSTSSACARRPPLLDSGLERQEKQNNDRFFPLAFNLSKPCLWRRRSTYLSSMTVLPEKTIRRSEGSSREHVSGKIAENVSFFGLTARSRLSSRMEISVLRSLLVIVMMRTPSFREISQIIQLFYDS